LLVKDIMTIEVVSFRADDSLASAAKTFIDKKISAGPVVDEEGNVVGIISETDLMKVVEYHTGLGTEILSLIPWVGTQVALQRDFKEMDKLLHKIREARVKDRMTTEAFTVHPEDEVSRAAEAMMLRKVNHIPVVDAEGKLIGIVARADIIRAIVIEGV